MSDKQLYEFTQEGFFAGDFYKVGAKIRLYPKQAQHELHRMQPVAPVESLAPAAEATPAPRARSSRSKA